jgi:hypothetical protein
VDQIAARTRTTKRMIYYAGIRAAISQANIPLVFAFGVFMSGIVTNSASNGGFAPTIAGVLA